VQQFFGNPHSIPKECTKCGGTFVTLPAVEDTVLPLVLRTSSNIRTYWRKSMCPRCIIGAIRTSYVQKFGRYWNRPPLDWWGLTEEATISGLVRWTLDRGMTTKYEFESCRMPRNFIDFCLGK
jgi:hypothetical protein